MLGRAIRGSARARPDYILGTAMEDLGYARHRASGRPTNGVYSHERWQLDLGAVQSPEEWNRDCWLGTWNTVLALEVENNLQEFSLTMRGLMDVRANLRVGIFYTDRDEHGLGDQPVGVGTQTVRLDAWSPAALSTPRFPLPIERGAAMCAIFLSTERPRLVGYRTWKGPTAV
jgi:hypothetical protein